MVNAHNAAHIATVLDLKNIALNDSAHFNGTQRVTISNNRSKPQVYKFGNVAAATAFTLSSGISPAIFPPPLSEQIGSVATIRFDPKSLTLAPNSSGVVTLHFNCPHGLNASRIPVYSGFVSIKGSQGDVLTLPYAGIASSLKRATIVDRADGFPFLTTSSDPKFKPIKNNKAVFVIPRNANAPIPPSGLPTIIYALAMGSRVVRLDVQPRKTSGLPLILGSRVIGSVQDFPLLANPRLAPTIVEWDGQIDNGTFVPPGQYRFLLRALKIFGNETNGSDYEMYHTPYFEIKYSS